MKEKVITCLHCGNKTSMKVVASYDTVEHEEIWGNSDNLYNPAYVTTYYKRWEMYLCPVCTEITIQRSTSFSEETEPNGKPITYTDIIFPSGSSENKHLPQSVLNAFDAALKVRNLDGAVCIMALRRTLEMMCKHKNAKGKDLFAKLKDLQSENILPPIMEGVSYILRKEGNSAAHADDKEFSSETVEMMIEFTEVILDYVYSLPAKIEQAQLRLNRESNKKEESGG
ncbi:DUF4145 domain-containing protein [Paenibacillus sp. 2TAB19]|uniref:DUF4145 domain-containing protein n=1 Tax=Paenibacillus sp. 2TAB19 TaxID=3233003 RepID=UPI003F94F7A1